MVMYHFVSCILKEHFRCVNSYQFVATYCGNDRTSSMNMVCDPRSNEHSFKHFLLASDKQVFASALVQLRIDFSGIFKVL